MGPKVFEMLKIPEDSNRRNAVRIKNPMGEENSLMRTTTIHGMLETISRNISHRNEEGRFFELGKIFIPSDDTKKELHSEEKVISIGMYGDTDFYDIKGIIQELLEALGINDYDFIPETTLPTFHPGRTARIYTGEAELGIVGEIHPDILEEYEISTRTYIATLYFNSILSNVNMMQL